MNYESNQLYSFIYGNKARLGRFVDKVWINDYSYNKVYTEYTGGHFTSTFLTNEGYRSFFDIEILGVRKANVWEYIKYICGY